MACRLLTLTFWRTPDGRLLAAIVLSGALLVAAVVVQVRGDAAMCSKVDKLAQAQIGGLRRGLKTLPTIAYYRDNPDELAATKTAIKRQIRDIAAASC